LNEIDSFISLEEAVFTVQFSMHIKNGEKGRKYIREGAADPRLAAEPGKIQRVSRLMALAIHLDDLVRRGDVDDFATVARAGEVSRTRISQIMNLLNIAPGIQEEILFLPRIFQGRDSITERHLRSIVQEADWKKQRRLWMDLKAAVFDKR
jgi:hypothetical protein